MKIPECYQDSRAQVIGRDWIDWDLVPFSLGDYEVLKTMKGIDKVIC